VRRAVEGDRGGGGGTRGQKEGDERGRERRAVGGVAGGWRERGGEEGAEKEEERGGMGRPVGQGGVVDEVRAWAGREG